MNGKRTVVVDLMANLIAIDVGGGSIVWLRWAINHTSTLMISASLFEVNMTKQKYIEVVNFDRFQHYKMANPPWIKMYYSLLSDYKFSQLPDQSKFHLMAIYMVASRNSNRIPNNIDWLTQEIKSKSEIDLKPLIDANFIRFWSSHWPFSESYF